MTRRARVVLADDHTLVTEALVGLLAPRFDVVATVADGHALLEVVRDLEPDVAIVDIAMPMLNGLDAARHIRQSTPACRMIFLTMAQDPDLAAEAFRVGALGFLLKTSAGWELVQAVESALRGNRYVTPSLQRALQEAPLEHPEASAHAELTTRQREVLRLLASGQSMKQVARELGVSRRTVAFHKYQVMGKFHLASNAELVQFAIRQGVIGP